MLSHTRKESVDVFMYTWVHACVPVPVCRCQRSTSGFTAQVLTTLLVETCMSLTWGLWLGYASCETQKSSCLFMPSAGITVTEVHATILFWRVLGFFLFVGWFVFLFLFFASVFACIPLCGSVWPRTFYVDHSGLKLDCTTLYQLRPQVQSNPSYTVISPGPKKKS